MPASIIELMSMLDPGDKKGLQALMQIAAPRGRFSFDQFSKGVRLPKDRMQNPYPELRGPY